MKTIYCSALFSLLAATSLSPALAQSHNAANEFNNPQWVYGQRSGTTCGTLGAQMTSAYNQFPGATGYSGSSSQQFIPLVAKTGSAALVASTVNIPANTVWMHPGADDVCASLGYKAAPGGYVVQVTMKPVDTTGPNHVRGYLYVGGVLQGAVEDLMASAGSRSFSRSVSITSPGLIEFVLDAGGEPNGFYFDSTSIDMTVTRRGDPGDGNGGSGGDNYPVLTCSQRQNSPASVNLSTGQSGWTLKLPSGVTSSIVPTPNMVPSPWTAVPGAQWVGPQGDPQASGNYVYETKVRVLKCPNGSPAKITAQFRADNRGTLTLLDPAGITLTTMNQAGTPNYGFLPGSLSPASAPGVHTWSASTNGIYTVRMTVQNSGGPTGLAANIVLSR